MKFNTLKERMEYMRSLTDYKLIPNTYVMCMLDGRSFSKLIKNKFEKPFDENFIYMMNETAKYLCENVGGCKFAFTQSDEISLLIGDFDTPTTDSFFGYRICKLQSILASIATSKFNQLYIDYLTKNSASVDEIRSIIKNAKLAEFDCKVWNLTNENDVYSWFLYRQIDCIRNSKQQAAQTFLTHKELAGKNVDEQISLLKEKFGKDWNDYKDGEKFGRFIFKEEKMVESKNKNALYAMRHKWEIHNAFLLTEENAREKLINIIKYYNYGVLC